MFVPPPVMNRIRFLLAWGRKRQATEQRSLLESDWDLMDAAAFLQLKDQVVVDPTQFVIPPPPPMMQGGGARAAGTTSSDPDVLFKKGL